MFLNDRECSVNNSDVTHFIDKKANRSESSKQFKVSKKKFTLVQYRPKIQMQAEWFQPLYSVGYQTE